MKKASSKIIFFLIAVMTGLIVAEYFKWIDLPWYLFKDFVINFIGGPLKKLLTGTIMSPAFAIVLIVTLVMERLYPAEKNKKMFSLSFAQDLVWFLYESILHALIIATVVELIKTVYAQHFAFMTIEAANVWPEWARFALGVLLLDFLYWWQHYINHKVPFFWKLHSVHHSQKQLNFFTDFRYHVLEYVVRESVLAVPFLVLHVDVPKIVAFSVFRRWYTRFYHGNIRMNMGPLRHVLVTPQSHRIHHSFQREHHDMNFGSLFCIWDHLFKTQYKNYDEYPATGITDEHFPHEKELSLGHLLTMPVVQMLYPFRDIFRSLRKKLASLKLTPARTNHGSKPKEA